MLATGLRVEGYEIIIIDALKLTFSGGTLLISMGTYLPLKALLYRD
jgi:hypothetical protein